MVDLLGFMMDDRRHGKLERRGTRVVGTVLHGHWKTTTFVAALRTNGLTTPLRLRQCA